MMPRPRIWKLRSAITAPGKPSQFCGRLAGRVGEARIVDRPGGERDHRDGDQAEDDQADQADRDGDGDGGRGRANGLQAGGVPASQ